MLLHNAGEMGTFAMMSDISEVFRSFCLSNYLPAKSSLFICFPTWTHIWDEFPPSLFDMYYLTVRILISLSLHLEYFSDGQLSGRRMLCFD